MKSWIRERVVRVADAMRSRSTDGFVVDLNALARDWRAVDVLYRARNMHGYTEWTARGPVVQVAVGRSDGRRRSTLAHECAHLALDALYQPQRLDSWTPEARSQHAIFVRDKLGSASQAATELLSAVEYEALCDKIAAELLVPITSAKAFRRNITSIDSLTRVCEERRVSFSLMVNRLNDAGANLFLMRLEPTPAGSWLVIEASGVPRSLKGRVACTDESSTFLDRIGPGRHDVTIGLETFRHEFSTSVSLRRHRRSVIALGSRSNLASGLDD